MTDILLFIVISLFAVGLFKLTVSFIIPRYFLRRHKLAFDVPDDKAFYEVYQTCKDYRVAATYDETDDEVSIVRFVVPSWREKRILGAFRAIENVEVY